MALPEVKTLVLALDAGVLHLTFNRPESRNAMSPEVLADIEAVFDSIREDRGIRAVVMRGAGGWFCAGADLKNMLGSALKPPAPGQADPLVAVNRAFGTMLRKVQAAPQVVIAVCEGAALAGGMGLVCVSDVALAHVDCKFGVPETARGLPPAQIAPFLVERMGLTTVRRLALTGAQFKGNDALRHGLVHETFASEDELKVRLDETLTQVRGCAPNANALTKAILLNVGRLDMDAVLDDAAQKFATCARSAEAAEGITAFMQKRKPGWTASERPPVAAAKFFERWGGMKRFDKVLIANRGEIAVRVIRGARKLGYRTVAVYSDADRDSLHVLEADEAVRIGPAPSKESYLVIENIIAAARQSGAGAIHPGYGFLSEREAFSQAVQDAGLVFIGPDPFSIEAMGNKSASKIRMIAAGVPCVPGYQGDDQSDDTLVREAKKAGLPVMVKAAAGGGGRGMRLVHDEKDLLAAIQSARSEAANAFGSGQLLIEKAVVDARHVEIQVFGDRHGNVVHFGERDCSVQRRNQKVVEEAPSPALDEALRLKMGASAVAAARAVKYVGAGTVEFMLARDKQFYFLEMNTRLQVEHPVTELVYGVDLVEWQLRVAQGERLPLDQEQILARRNGWAIEVRLCAEDPQQNYLPQTGKVLAWKPAAGEGLRIDTYLREGQEISPFYDSMQAKVIAWGQDREVARQRLLGALAQTTLLGVVNNKDYLSAILAHEAFASGDFSTAFIGKHFPQEQVAAAKPDARHVALAAVALYMDEAFGLATEHGLTPEFIGWHSSHETPAEYKLKWRDSSHALDVLVQDGHLFTVLEGESKTVIDVTRNLGHEFHYICDGVQGKARIAHDGDSVWIEAEGQTRCYTDVTLAPAAAAAAGSDGRLLAHSDGKIVAVHVKPGETVEPGRTLAVLEAMKMEFQLTLPVGGTVQSVPVQAGQQVKNRQLLVQVKPAG